MSALEPGRPRRGARGRARGGAVRIALVTLLVTLSFLLGIAFSRTLDERPSQGPTVTTVATLPSQETVTVTATSP